MAFIGSGVLVFAPKSRALSCRRLNSVRRVRSNSARMMLAESDAKKQLEVQSREIFMPALSSTMETGRIVQWLKQPGDPVKKGDAVMVVESDKADMDVESFEDGFLATILVQEGEECNVGETVALIAPTEADIERVKECNTECIVSGSGSRHDGTTAVDTPVSTPPTAADPFPKQAASTSVEKPDFREVFMPALSSTMTEGKVVDWLKSEGDFIKTGEMVLVVESDKADMDVESFEEGYLAHIAVEAGSSCPVSQAVGYLATSKEDMAKVKAWAEGSSSAPSDAASGNGVAVEEVAAPAETPSTSVAASTGTASHSGRIVASPYARKVSQQLGVDLSTVAGSGPGGRIVEADVRNAEKNGAFESTQFVSSKLIATPEAKKLAKKEGVKLESIKGTGNFGRITVTDVLRAAGKEVSAAPTTAVSTSASAAPVAKDSDKPAASAPATVPDGAVAMNAMQKAVVKNMNATLTVPVFRVTRSVCTDGLDELYKRVKSKGVSMSALLAKAVAQTIALHPIMNAAYVNESIVYRKEVNVGMAVSLPDGGLITPVLRDAANVDIYSLGRTWRDLVKRSSTKKLTPEEYTTGTFFISNMGMFGVDSFDAILPPGAPSILAVAASKPVVTMLDSGLVGVRKEMKLNITCDHRHIYGADAAKFLLDLADLIENKAMDLLL